MLICVPCGTVLNLFISFVIFWCYNFLPDMCIFPSETAIVVQVISSMRVLMTEDSNNAVSSSFLLDDDSR